MKRGDRFCLAFLLVVVLFFAIRIVPAFFDGTVKHAVSTEVQE